MKTFDEAIRMTWFFALVLFAFRIDGMGLISEAPGWLVLATAFLPMYVWAITATVKALCFAVMSAIKGYWRSQ